MSDYLDKIDAVRTNPNLMINIALDELERQLTGQGDFDIPDGSHPFVFALENGTLMAAMAMSEGESILRRLYPNNAITTDDLYHHMSDDDYLNRFANPALSHFEIYLHRDELIAAMVPVGVDGIKKVVIPRLTSVKVAGHYFTMQYPIEIRQMRHGGLQVVYDLATPSPIQTMDTNIVETKELMVERRPYLLLRVPMYQMEAVTHFETLNPSIAFEASFTFTDQFFHARAYMATGANQWTEIATTHSDQVFDPTKLTLVLKVVGNRLLVEFPLLYTTNGMARGEIRLDIYTTKGEIDVDLGSYQVSSFETNFNSIDDNSTYTDPLTTIRELQVLSPQRVRGGSNALDFNVLRDSVIDGVIGDNKLPITGIQLENYLERRGYTLVSNIDNITDRQFLASRRLPPPNNQSVASSVGTMMGQIQLSMEQVARSQHVADNGDRITLLPTMLYNYNNGIITAVDDGVIASLRNSSPEAVTRAIGETRYLYTPFHYVLDATGANFDVRPYYLGEPSIVRKTFVEDNDSSQLQASIDTYNIQRMLTGYRITIKLKSGDQFKQLQDELVVVQMGYRPVGENNYASINGTLIGMENNERIYQFDIHTNFDVDTNDNLYTLNLSMFDSTQTHFALGMEHDLDFTFIVNQVQTPGYVANSLDAMVQEHLLNHTYMTVVRERLTTRFGYTLTDLWRRNRTILSSESYLRHEVDIPAVYADNVYDRDEEGNIIIGQDGAGGLTYTLLHRSGDPVLDTEGEPVMQFREGDAVLDHLGQPTLVAPRKIMREFTLFLVDGMYYFATEESSVIYRNEIPMQVVDWVQGDIATIRKQLLERAEIYFYPITTFGNTTATVKEGLLADITLDQGLNITYYMSPASYRNTALRPTLIETTKRVVTEQLSRTRVVRSDMVAALKMAAGEDVSGIEVTGLGGTVDFGILTVEDPAVRLSLRKKLTVLTNQDLMVEDDLNINFLRH